MGYDKCIGKRIPTKLRWKCKRAGLEDGESYPENKNK